MKRILSLFIVLVLVLGTLASCDLSWIPFLSSETDIQEAVDYIDDMYESANGSATDSDYEVVNELLLDGTKFTITWTTNNENVKVSTNDEGGTIIVVPTNVSEEYEYKIIGKITSPKGQEATVEYTRVMAPVFGVIAEPEVGVAYKLALLHGGWKTGASVVYFDGDNYNGYAWYLNLAEDKMSAVDVYLEEVEGVEGGLRLYFMKDGVKTYIRMYQDGRSGYEKNGTLEMTTTCPDEHFTYDAEHKTLIWTNANGEKSYMGSSGTFSSISASHIDHISEETTYLAHFYGMGGEIEKLPEANLPEIPENYTSQDIVDALYQLKAGQKTPDTYEITGKVIRIDEAYSSQYENITVTIEVEGREDKPVKIYRGSGIGADEIKVGDTITVRGQLTNYGGNSYQIDQGGYISSIIPGEGGDDIGGGEGGETTKIPTVVDSPVVGTAYKFGMFQTNLDKFGFITGNMKNTHYFETTDDYSKGLDVYLEETTGGYYLYTTINGTKTYINIVVSGNYKNAKYEAAPSTVYTYDTAKKALVTTIDTAVYTLGGYGTFDTICPCDTAKQTFYAQFYTLADAPEGGEGNEGGNEGGGETSTPDATLDTTGTTNRTSYATDKIVFSANGITFTVDKANSNNNCYDMTGKTYACRVYFGATVKVEYTGMTMIVLVMDDFKDSNNDDKQYMFGFDGMTVEGATIIRDYDKVYIVFDEATDVFQSANLLSQVRVKSVEVYTGEVSAPDIDDGNGDDQTPDTNVFVPVEGQAYKFYMFQGSLNKNYYFTGTMSGNYLATSDDASLAVDVYFESVDGGYRIYFFDGETKVYFNISPYLDDQYIKSYFALTEEVPTCVWTFNSEYGTLEVVAEMDGQTKTLYAGNYGSNTPIRLSDVYYYKDIPAGTQHIAKFELAEGGEVTPPEGGDDTTTDGDNTTNKVPTVVDAPVVGTAYKFGLLHGGNGNVDVYFDGQNYSTYAWYLNYTTDWNNAVDVYLEAVEGIEGAYRLYFMKNDVKTYIRAYPRTDKPTDGTLEMTTTVPAEYFTYSAEYKTLIYTMEDGSQFYLGSSGTYKSISCSAISYITSSTSYIAHFYTLADAE